MPETSLIPVKPRGNIHPGVRYFLTLVLTAPLLLLSEMGLSQSRTQLNQLIFDPVILNPETQQTIPASFPAQNSDNKENINGLVFQDLENIEETEESQVISIPDISFNIEQYEEQLATIEGDAGPFATDLYETLLDLGNQYQQLNHHESAIEIFERAEYVSRINHGLFHPEQVASIEGLIESYMAIGDLKNANAKQRYLIYLSEQYFGENNLNDIPSIISLAEQNMTNYERVLNMPVQPSISFSSSGSSRQPTPRQIAFGSLYQAQQNYVRAISTLMENRQFFDPTLIELEHRYIETLFLQAYRAAIIKEPDYYMSEKSYRTGTRVRSNNRRNSVSYLRGVYAFERMLIYVRNNPMADPLALTDILMNYGDWNLLFGHTRSAAEKYAEANQEAINRKVPELEIEKIFRPAMPVHLPLVAAKPNSREKFGIAVDESLDYDGYVDISFTVSRFGRAGDIEILGKSGNVTKKIEQRLKKYLRNSPFRPRLQKDGSINEESLTLRYHFAYADKQEETQDTSS